MATNWLTLFVIRFQLGVFMFKSHLEERYQEALSTLDKARYLRSLAYRQRIVLSLFRNQSVVMTSEVAFLLSTSQRTARRLCLFWVKEGFFVVADPAKKSRKYRLAPHYERVLF